MHVPQCVGAYSEAQELMAVPHNMVSPSSTTAIIALVQETLVAWYRMTRRDVFFNRDTFMQLAAQIQYDPNDPSYPCQPTHSNKTYIPSIPAPSILKSSRGALWSGKQLMKLLLSKSIHLTRAVRDGEMKSNESWTGDAEEIIIIKHGELLNGRLCKATLGGGSSLVHQIWKDIGPWAAAKFVSDMQRVANVYNQIDAMSIGIRDCILEDSCIKEVDDLVATAMGKADALENTTFSREVKEMRASTLMQDVLRSAGRIVMKKMDKETALAQIVLSGTKGNALNLSQIMGVVGQQVRNRRYLRSNSNSVLNSFSTNFSHVSSSLCSPSAASACNFETQDSVHEV